MHGLISLVIYLVAFIIVMWFIIFALDMVFAGSGFWSMRFKGLIVLLFFLIFLLWVLNHLGIFSF